jgi:hypothetical protein
VEKQYSVFYAGEVGGKTLHPVFPYLTGLKNAICFNLPETTRIESLRMKAKLKATEFLAKMGKHISINPVSFLPTDRKFWQSLAAVWDQSQQLESITATRTACCCKTWTMPRSISLVDETINITATKFRWLSWNCGGSDRVGI